MCFGAVMNYEKELVDKFNSIKVELDLLYNNRDYLEYLLLVNTLSPAINNYLDNVRILK